LYSDFHPEAARVGLTRSFKDEQNDTCTVPHRCYGVALQQEAATAANLAIDVIHEVRVGIELKEPFPKSEEFYRRWDGLPIVLVVRARK
jgi:malonyl-CoA O-methyltransferase